MNLNIDKDESNISDNWGWYVDIENLSSHTNNFEKKRTINMSQNIKKLNIHLNKLDKIDEDDEFEYYVKNSKGTTIYDCLNYNYDKLDMENNNKETFYTNKIVKIGSTTLLTALLTYFILFIL